MGSNSASDARSTDGAPSTAGTDPALKLVLFGVFAAVALAFVAALLFFARGMAREPLHVLSAVPEFSFTNRDGRTITRADLDGRPWVADFMFTRCIAVCPRMTQQMKSVDERLPENVGLVSFSVDPEYDTPEVLAEYAERHGVADDWYFLTGEMEAIDELTVKAFLLPIDRSPDPELMTTPDPIMHSNRLVLVDADANIRGYYDAFDEEALGQLQVDVRRVLAERR